MNISEFHNVSLFRHFLRMWTVDIQSQNTPLITVYSVHYIARLARRRRRFFVRSFSYTREVSRSTWMRGGYHVIVIRKVTSRLESSRVEYWMLSGTDFPESYFISDGCHHKRSSTGHPALTQHDDYSDRTCARVLNLFQHHYSCQYACTSTYISLSLEHEFDRFELFEFLLFVPTLDIVGKFTNAGMSERATTAWAERSGIGQISSLPHGEALIHVSPRSNSPNRTDHCRWRYYVVFCRFQKWVPTHAKYGNCTMVRILEVLKLHGGPLHKYWDSWWQAVFCNSKK